MPLPSGYTFNLHFIPLPTMLGEYTGSALRLRALRRGVLAVINALWVIGLIDKDGTILGLKYFEYNQLSVFKDSNVVWLNGIFSANKFIINNNNTYKMWYKPLFY